MGLASISVENGARNQELTALIRSVAVGDESAMATLYDSTSRLVYGLALRILGNAATAEDVLMDVYTQVWRQASQYDDKRGAPLAWLTTIARSRAIDRLRSGAQENRRRESLESVSLSAPTTSAEDFTIASEMQKLVRVALDSLSLEQREVIELAYYGGYSHSEIASKLGQPLGTVKTRIRLGMMKLREMLKPTYERGL